MTHPLRPAFCGTHASKARSSKTSSSVLGVTAPFTSNVKVCDAAVRSRPRKAKRVSRFVAISTAYSIAPVRQTQRRYKSKIPFAQTRSSRTAEHSVQKGASASIPEKLDSILCFLSLAAMSDATAPILSRPAPTNIQQAYAHALHFVENADPCSSKTKKQRKRSPILLHFAYLFVRFTLSPRVGCSQKPSFHAPTPKLCFNRKYFYIAFVHSVCYNRRQRSFPPRVAHCAAHHAYSTGVNEYEKK